MARPPSCCANAGLLRARICGRGFAGHVGVDQRRKGDLVDRVQVRVRRGRIVRPVGAAEAAPEKEGAVAFGRGKRGRLLQDIRLDVVRQRKVVSNGGLARLVVGVLAALSVQTFIRAGIARFEPRFVHRPERRAGPMGRPVFRVQRAPLPPTSSMWSKPFSGIMCILPAAPVSYPASCRRSMKVISHGGRPGVRSISFSMYTTPCWCGYRPVWMHARLGMHTGF